MRRFTMPSTLAAAAIMLTLVGCSASEPEIKTKASPSQMADEEVDQLDKDLQDAAKEAEEIAEEAKTANPVASIGDTITLKGFEDGEQLAVTVKKFADPAKSADEFFAPEDGNRWVGVQLEIVNTGTKVYDDSPGNGMQVADSEGQRFSGVLADITAGPSMAASVKLLPGAKALGWEVFEVPKNSKMDVVQFGMNSGFSDQTGQWKLQ